MRRCRRCHYPLKRGQTCVCERRYKDPEESGDVFLPTQEQIREACAAIRAGWDRHRWEQQPGAPREWRAPEVRDTREQGPSGYGQ